jgi:hypothetical protein
MVPGDPVANTKSDILCEHNLVDLARLPKIKRVSRETWAMVASDHYQVCEGGEVPEGIRDSKLCQVCVSALCSLLSALCSLLSVLKCGPLSTAASLTPLSLFCLPLLSAICSQMCSALYFHHCSGMCACQPLFSYLYFHHHTDMRACQPGQTGQGRGRKPGLHLFCVFWRVFDMF